MKKISIFILSVIICFSFIGCSNEEKEITTSSTSETTVAVSEEETSVTDETTSESQENGKTEENEKTEQKEENKNEDKTTTTTKKQNSTTKKTQTTQKSTTTKSTTTSTTSKSTYTCYVTIECTVVLDNMDDLKAGHESYVPSDGYFVKNEKVTVKKGSTAYDAVKSVCDKNGIKVSTSGSGKTVYIQGFNNIDEFDCGNASGWTYYVNNKFPLKSCGDYTVSDGDSIKFTYVC